MEQSDSEAQGGTRSGIVTARGTGEGLVIRLDGRVKPDALRSALFEFISSRKGFLEGNEVFLEWVGETPEEDFVYELSRSLAEDFQVTVKGSRLREQLRVGGDADDVPGLLKSEDVASDADHAILSIRSLGSAEGKRFQDANRSEGARSEGKIEAGRGDARFSGRARGQQPFDWSRGDTQGQSPTDEGALDSRRERRVRGETRKRSLFDGVEVIRMGDSSDEGFGRGDDVFSMDSSERGEQSAGISAGSKLGAGAAAPGRERSRWGVNPLLWDDPDARVVQTTLRGGQRIESDHSVIVFGDVNSGAEVIAGGDIVVLGTLRGVAHAGAYDESGGGRVIFALNLQPTQLRIGAVISRGQSDGLRGAEIARIEGTMIVVEPYQSRVSLARR